MCQSEPLFVTIGSCKVREINGSEDTHVFVDITVWTLDEVVCGVHVE